eukprot:CAMPEP_0197359872 /NCGR_PEP_ID=MMETSP0893-20130614/59792_1 /TAXON_ID=44058 ORGANISM="Aureoumbra lagunensis, Strain CCMP1510" /NCGR_SAMPLE_ID=MMETSP0893 /ASSEMBLY_ACC=CAM_ASM_000539 /LENGTH=45 /DNA_ID= /DNA_START= /DNA_END= /DNA_ORIENTATION=
MHSKVSYGSHFCNSLMKALPSVKQCQHQAKPYDEWDDLEEVRTLW